MNSDAEKALKNCNPLKQIRSTGEKCKVVAESIKQPIDQVSDIMPRLELKGKHFEVKTACFDDELDAVWEIALQIEPSLSQDDTSRDKTKDKERLQAFLSHCCQLCHYTFCIKVTIV